MTLKLWNALLLGSVSHPALLTRLYGRDPRAMRVIRTMTTRTAGATTTVASNAA